MSEVENKRKKTKTKYTMRFYAIITALIVIVVGFVLSRTLFFNISNVTYESDTPYTKEEVMSTVKISMGDNLFNMNLDKRAENLTKNLPYVAEAKFERKLPTTLKITVKAPKIWANIRNDDGTYYLVSDNGKVLEVGMPEANYDYPAIFGYEPKNTAICATMESVSPEKKALTDEIFAALNKNGIEGIHGVDLTNLNEIKVQYNSTQVISYGTAEDIEFKTELAKAIIDQRANPDESGIINVKSTQYPAFIGTHGGGVSKPENTEATDGEADNNDDEDEPDYDNEDDYNDEDDNYNDEDDNYYYDDDNNDDNNDDNYNDEDE